MRLIDADALEKEYRRQFESVYKGIRDTVNPTDFYIERKAAYDKELVRREMEAFYKFLQSRPTIDAVLVVRCKNCVYRNIPNCCPCQLNGFKVTYDWYCPMGVTEVHND